MMLLEHEAKAMLAEAGIAIPRGEAELDDEASVVVKAQVPVGGRGKAGGIRIVHDRAEVAATAAKITLMTIGGHTVESVLVEEALEIERELYLAVAIDSSAGRPVVLAAPAGGVDIENAPDQILRVSIDPVDGISSAQVAEIVNHLSVDGEEVLRRLLALFFERRALLVEINPLVRTVAGALVAADAKIELDDVGESADGTAHEQRAAAAGLRMIELGGNVAILANGAGLTMATMDAVSLAGGQPANFLEIGGDAYTKATPALEIVLGLPGVKSLLVNFCGAFARCDVMTAGVVEAWEALRPELPVFFSIHGTGQDEARALVVERLGIEPFDCMDDAVRAAVEAAA